MRIVLKIAWRNIWRHKTRSFVLITAIALGLWAGVFASAFVMGMMKQKIDDVIKTELSHFQIHAPRFTDDLRTKYFITDAEAIQKEIEKDERVQGASGRIVTMVMMGTANQTGFIKLTGIAPEQESKVTGINTMIVEGDYLDSSQKKSVIISRKIAEKFKIGLRSKVVLTFLDVSNEITSAAFRVAGIYKTGNPRYDEDNIFVLRNDMQSLLGIENRVHEIAVLLKGYDITDTLAVKYQKMYPALEVKSWMDISSGMRFMVEAFDTYLYIIIGIILLALLFSIVNTMLMAVLERTKEIGVLVAIGMTKKKIFAMIILETTFITIIGGSIGLLLSRTFIAYFGTHGIDLSGAAYGEMGFGTIIYPILAARHYASITFMVFMMAMIAALFPARRALKLVPAEAIRKI